jgi:hypothetical protein
VKVVPETAVTSISSASILMRNCPVVGNNVAEVTTSDTTRSLIAPFRVVYALLANFSVAKVDLYPGKRTRRTTNLLFLVDSEQPQVFFK